MMHGKPTRICFPFTGDVVGGSHLSVLGLVRNLDPSRFTPVIVPQYHDGAIADLFRPTGLLADTRPRWTRLPYDSSVGPWKMVQLLKDIPAQVRFLRTGGFDIVHSNDGRTHATWGPAARLSGARLLWHQRGDPTAIGLRLAAPLLANRVVAVSRFASPRPGLWSAARRCTVVHSPFATDTNEDRAAARAALVAELGCDPNTAFIGFSGAFISRKRPFLFIDAIAELAGRRLSRPVMGLMFGEAYDGGRTETALVDHARKCNVADIVKLMGFRTPGPRWLAACDMLMVPAFGEPFGRTLIEAMLVGTPVVATASGGNIEALKNGEIGLLVPPETAVALANAALVLVDWPMAAATIAAKASEDAVSRFGETLHADQIMAVYEELLGRNAPPKPRPAPMARQAAMESESAS
jgi:glycosyltransferase involved in cell wall biosynthesis